MRCACTAPHREMPVIARARIRAAARMVFTGYPSRIFFCFDAGVARGDSACSACVGNSLPRQLGGRPARSGDWTRRATVIK